MSLILLMVVDFPLVTRKSLEEKILCLGGERQKARDYIPLGSKLGRKGSSYGGQ